MFIYYQFVSIVSKTLTIFCFFFIFPTNLFIIVKKVLPLQPKKVKTSAEPWQKAVAKQMIQGTIICIQPVFVDQINFYPI
ncbi:hypothetical protein CIK95_00990 [Prevotella sp. P5-108]|nr:hypothetical protein CIK95_00990 [Prevotella sp. P5-108]